jgi:quercetin dioxygenase-like cupin family protein
MSEQSTMTYCTTRGSEAPVREGRRSFFDYFDLGVTGASDGWMRADIIKPKTGQTKTTGWHYHECEGQFVYMLEGWLRMEFEDGHVFTLEPGDSMFIPGGQIHNEAETSAEFTALELSVPALMGTVPVETPAGFQTAE